MTPSPGPRRVALVSASANIIGGHSVQAAALAAALRADGVAVDEIAIDRPMPPWLRRIRGVRTLVNEGLYAAALRRATRADVVHVFSASYWSFLLAPVPAMIAGRLAGRRVVLHYHSGEVADHLAHWGWRVHPWLRLAHEIVVCSQFQADCFSAHRYTSRVIPNLADLDRFAYRERYPVMPRFISTRNFEPHYGVDVVLRAFALVRDVYPSASLTVIGAGSEERRLKALAAALGDEGIRFLGAVRPGDMPAQLAGADIFLNASTIDNQPVSIIEACCSGLPVVSTRVGGIPDMVEHNRSGLLVRDAEPRAMAAAALRLIEDPEKALRLARRARERASMFTWPSIRQQWADVYWPPARSARTPHVDQAGVPSMTTGARA